MTAISIDSTVSDDPTTSEGLGDEGAPLGVHSLVWKYFGDWRTALMIPAAGIMQLMLPGLGAGVTQHSQFFEEPLERVLRSIPPILGVVYDGPEAATTAARVRDYHRDIKGADADGRRYHALDPEVYFWAHATFIWSAMTMADIFDHRLSDAEKQQMYEEGKSWYRRYGLSDRPMPEDWYAFRAYFDRMCAHRLVVTESAGWVVSRLDEPGTAARPPGVPEVVWRLLGPAFMHQYRLIAAGTVPPVLRERLGLTWGPAERRRFRMRVALIRRLWPLVPEPLRYQPRAWAGFVRERSAAR